MRAAIPTSRQTLRRDLRKSRAALSVAEREQAASHSLERLVKLNWFRRAKRIALYHPVRGEFNPLPLLDEHVLTSTQFYMPVVKPGSSARMGFAAWHGNSLTRANSYGIPEPLHRRAALRDAKDMDLVITPLVGFDAECNRLGAGGGYYDRSFAFRNRGGAWHRPRLIGVAFECQRLQHIATESWDVSLDAVVTEHALYLR